MKQFVKRLQTRSFDRIFYRMYTIAKRYGLTRTRYLENLRKFLNLTAKYGTQPTFPLTAVVLAAHRDSVKQIQDLGAEFAIHGYRHIDYSLLDLNEFGLHLELAKDLFFRNSIKGVGFRFPYLRQTEAHIKELKKYDFNWDSSEVISWDIPNLEIFAPVQLENYQRILDSYSPNYANEDRSLPKMMNGLVEIPVSMPDDDILIERLEIKQNDLLFKIWNNMFEDIYRKEELFVFQLHPERFIEFQPAIAALLQEMSNRNVWMASLGEISNWWNERDTFKFIIDTNGEGKYTVTSNSRESNDVIWYGLHKDRVIHKGEKYWDVDTYRPIIGVSPNADKKMTNMLKIEGFSYEISEDQDLYNLYLTEEHFGNGLVLHELISKMDKMDILIPRFNRWPAQAACAVALTGDIDCISIFDFFNRVTG